MLSEVEQESETTKQSFDKLSQHAAEVEDEAGNHLETARSNIEEFRLALDGATSSFNDRKASATEHFEAFEENFRNKLESLTNDFGTVVQEGNTKLATVQNTLDTTSGDVITAMSQKFVEDAVGELSSSADKLTEATSTLREGGESASDLLDGKIGDIIDQLDEVVDIIEEIKPVRGQ